MSVGPFTLTNPGLLAHQDGDIDLDNDPMVAVLIDNSYTPNLADDVYSDISGDEVTDLDYVPVVAVLTVTGNIGIVKVDMSQINFGDTVTIAARYIYILKGNATPVAGDLILGFMDLNDGGSQNVSSNNSDFKVSANVSNGLYQITKAA